MMRIDIIHKELSYKLVGLIYKTQNKLGRYARENQYANFLENLLKIENMPYEKEKMISQTGKDINRVDFLIDKSIVLELKAKPFITKEDYYQLKRYLEFSKLKLGMLVNFRQKYLKPKRVLNSEA